MAKKITIDLEAKTDKAIAGIDKLGKEVKDLNKQVLEGNQDTKKGLEGIEESSRSTAKGIKGIGTAIKAAGIGLLLGALGKLKEVFEQNQKVADLFATSFEFISIVFNDFVNFIVNNTGAVTNFFKAIFENPKKSLTDFADAFKRNIQERFESYLDTLGYLASAVKKVFSGDFAGALDDVKSAGKESLDVLTGVNDTFDKGTEFVEKTTKAIKNYTTETIKSAKENVNLANAAQLAAAQQGLLVEKYDIQAEKLRQIRDDESKSIEERKKANEDLAKVLDDQEKAMLQQADAQIRAAQAEVEKNNSIENQVALTEALANKQGVLAQIEGFRSEQKTNAISLDKEEVDLINAKLESDSKLSIERKRFNAEQIEDEVARLEALKQVDLLEQEQEAARLQAIVDNANAGTQAKVDAQIVLDEFLEQSRQKNAERDKNIDDLNKLRREQTIADAKNTFDQVAQLAGKDSKIGKAMAIASATISGVQGVQNAYTTAQKSPITVLFPAYPVVQAALAAGIAAKNIAAIKSVDSSGKGGGGAPSTTTATSQPPSFNIVGATETSQLADAVAGQTQQPVQAYVVANDVTTAQSLENNIVEGATL